MLHQGSEEMEILDLLDLLQFTFSNEFVEKWRHRYSTAFIEHFQQRLFLAMEDKKPVKRSSLTHYLVKKCKYNEDIVADFYDAIDIEIYYPVVLRG